ncbi:DinB family protein [Nocardia paucivorans]|uniref:DinB family protein n=1 Tax=Nocardia paucivorans TaxID=114259 RepID=UPI0002E37BC3|nr:DinB family protein [Nocardia paucivorans]
MWIAPEVERIEAIPTGAERPMLQSMLDRQRRTLLSKCVGLRAEELKRRSVEPSTLSLHGLIRHLAEVERGWLRITAAGEQLDYLYCSIENPDGDFADIDEADPATDFAIYHREIELADAAVAELPLDHICRHPAGIDFSLRRVYLHLIDEYARHTGHADLLRERIDGRTGY